MNFNILLFIFPPNCQARINIDKIKGNKLKYRFLVSTITINAKKKGQLIENLQILHS